ncbi:MAG: hypothetical protein ACRCYU_18200 [Nocardioides sp.]
MSTRSARAEVGGSERPLTELVIREGPAKVSVAGAEALRVSLPLTTERWNFGGPFDSLAIDFEGEQSVEDGESEDRFPGSEGTQSFDFVARQSEVVELSFTRGQDTIEVSVDMRS